MRSVWTTAACLFALLGACEDGTPARADAQVDGSLDALDDAQVDAGGDVIEEGAADAASDGVLSNVTRCPAEPDEDCAGCFQTIGRCCYGDATLGGRLTAVVAACRASATCAGCCNECAALTCAQHRTNHNCPNM